MKVVWTETNAGHISDHGVSREEVEAVFTSADLAVAPIPRTYRLTAEGTVAGRFLRVVFTRTGPDEVYPITAYRTSPRRRRT